MTPSIDTRLQTIIGALEHVVLPALAAADPIAQEQAALALGHLKIVRAHVEHVDDYHLICLAEMLRTARDLGRVAEGGEATLDAAEQLAAAADEAARREGNERAAVADRNRVAAAIDRLVIASSHDGTSAFLRRSQDVLIDHGLRQSRRDRSWYAATGLDPDRGELGSIEAMLAAEATGHRETA